MTGVVTFGETMALFSPNRAGRLGNGSPMTLGIGGAESNVAIGLSRLGTPATWLGRVGADPFGELIGRELRAEGVNAVLLVDDGAPTGLMVKERRIAGTTRVLYYRSGSAGSRLRPDDVDPSIVAGAELLHVSGITPALSPSAREATERAVEIARERSIPVSLDVNYRSALWSRAEAATALRPLLAHADIVFAGLDESPLLSGSSATDPHEQAALISALGPTRVIVKLGADGAVARVDGRPHRIRAVPVAAVDTVGAGDAFAAGYLAEYVSGADDLTALSTAAAAGALACLGHGDWESLPTRSDLRLIDADRDPISR